MIQPQMLLNLPEAADFCRCSKSTLNQLRVRGNGPPFIRVGASKIAYRREALVDWLIGREVRSTSEAAR